MKRIIALSLMALFLANCKDQGKKQATEMEDRTGWLQGYCPSPPLREWGFVECESEDRQRESKEYLTDSPGFAVSIAKMHSALVCGQRQEQLLLAN